MPKKKTDYCLVLDLDETLVSNVELKDEQFYINYKQNLPLGQGSRCFQFMCRDSLDDHQPQKVLMIHRHGFFEFISWVFSHFQHVVIWSAGIRPYVENIHDNLFLRNGFSARLILAREDCIVSKKYNTKPCGIVANHYLINCDVSKIIILDDNENAIAPEDVGRHIKISEFKPRWKSLSELDDTELKLARARLEQITSQ